MSRKSEMPEVPYWKWEQLGYWAASPIMPTHPEILKRLAREYPNADFEDEYRLDSGDAADYRSAIAHLRRGYEG